MLFWYFSLGKYLTIIYLLLFYREFFRLNEIPSQLSVTFHRILCDLGAICIWLGMERSRRKIPFNLFELDERSKQSWGCNLKNWLWKSVKIKWLLSLLFIRKHLLLEVIILMMITCCVHFGKQEIYHMPRAFFDRCWLTQKVKHWLAIFNHFKG